jgi:hypothetical protein
MTTRKNWFAWGELRTGNDSISLATKHIRQFLLEISRQTADGKKHTLPPSMYSVPDEYRSVMREHSRTISKMKTDDQVFVSLVDQLKTNQDLLLWYSTLVTHNREGLLSAPNLAVFMQQGIKHKDLMLEKVLQAIEDRVDHAEKYVVWREAVAKLVVFWYDADHQVEHDPRLVDKLHALREAAREKRDEYHEDEERFGGAPFSESWKQNFLRESMGLRTLSEEEEGKKLYEVFVERIEGLWERDDVVDDVVAPWMKEQKARETAELKERQAKEATEAREARLAESKAKRAEREATLAAAEEPQVQQVKQPPVHPDLAEAIEMVNVVDTSDRVEALKDLRETALVVALENPGDVQAERWASWAKEQLRLARRPDMEWSVIDGQFRACSFRPDDLPLQ